MSTRVLLTEMQILRTAVNEHKARIIAAQEILSDAIEEASRVVQALSDDKGYFWACSRLTDLERILGVAVPQLPLRTADNFVPLFCGPVPSAHETVASFLAQLETPKESK